MSFNLNMPDLVMTNGFGLKVPEFAGDIATLVRSCSIDLISGKVRIAFAESHTLAISRLVLFLSSGQQSTIEVHTSASGTKPPPPGTFIANFRLALLLTQLEPSGHQLDFDYTDAGDKLHLLMVDFGRIDLYDEEGEPIDFKIYDQGE